MLGQTISHYRIIVSGITRHPDQEWIEQQARAVSLQEWGFLAKHKYRLQDRDAKFCPSFRRLIETDGRKTIVLPARSANLNAYAERWVQSVKEECLSRFILFGERALRRALQQYGAHDHEERNHQGRQDLLLFPRPSAGACKAEGTIRCRERLGGLLKYNDRPGCSMSRLSVRLLLTAVAVSSLLLSVASLTAPAFADSQARVVRLSEVQGEVEVDRNTEQGFEKAFLNLPITQDLKLQTKHDGRAEVEFEDGSTLRVTPDTVIGFPQLSLHDSGAKAWAVHLQEGTAYVKFAGAKGDEFTLTFAHEKLSLAHSAHLRIEMADTTATLAVFSGDVQAEGESGTVAVSKNHTASFDLTHGDRYTLAKESGTGFL
jgi:hypothetical protein